MGGVEPAGGSAAVVHGSACPGPGCGEWGVHRGDRGPLSAEGRVLEADHLAAVGDRRGQSVLEVFHRLGTTGEGVERFGMVALDVPPQADLLKIRELLEHGETKEWWHWEEGCVTAAWEATARP
ncbi:DUF4265 domain-containing protein [Streptomyces virginiae]|uniref:DUF4265 domain-containing protein n=1 Tax=Streptomyces virginiae TaxID=1961 RepID=UPI002DDC221B|nr:DUF4265 domain-containing protein [Streptomyces virginiae]